MTEFIFNYFTTSLSMAFIILICWGCGQLLDFSPKIRYWAWIIVVIGLLVPLRPVFGNGLINADFGDDTNYEMLTRAGTLIEGTNLSEGTVPVQNAMNLPIVEILAAVWLVVAIVIFSVHMYKYTKFTRLVWRWGEDVQDSDILALFQKNMDEKGIAGIELKKCNFVTTSMLVGFFRPVVLLPDKYFDLDELDLIFRHELIHYKRWDLFVKLLSVVAVSLHWFNPAVYLMSGQMQTDCETSCDELVLQEVGEQNKQFYAEIIIDMTGKKALSTVFSTCFYSSRRNIERRLDAIMEAGAGRKLMLPSLAVFVALVIFSGSVFAFYEPTGFVDFPVDLEDFQNLENVNISPTEARDIALHTVGGGIFSSFYHDSHLNIYRIEILQDSSRYFLAVDVMDGTTVIYNSETLTTQTLNSAQAAEIALNAVGGGSITASSMELIDDIPTFLFTIATPTTITNLSINQTTGIITILD
ncbi:MAG: M56 family metallopeptidase [Turicibacter sp.]|nr:M56 family metallopeptidase [Turicibacter sp.]